MLVPAVRGILLVYIVQCLLSVCCTIQECLVQAGVGIVSCC